MPTGIKPRLGDIGFLSLVTVLATGILVDLIISPRSILAEIPEITFPLGLLLGFLFFASLLRVHNGSEHYKKRVGQFGWAGALIGGSIGGWLAIHQLALGIPFAQFYHEALTALDIGIAGGALIGVFVAATYHDGSQWDADRGRVLAESTWTTRPEPDPILVELVEQIAELEGIDPLEMEPLATQLNPEVFEAIRDGNQGQWQARFYTDKYEIRVNSQGTVTVYDAQRPDEERVSAPAVRAIR